jgi:hypothetical protein
MRGAFLGDGLTGSEVASGLVWYVRERLAAGGLWMSVLFLVYGEAQDSCTDSGRY